MLKHLLQRHLAAHPEHDIPNGLRAPNALLMMLEGRIGIEHAAYFAALPWLKRLPRGDGHPVLVLPGLGANDHSTALLRRFLDDLGYVTHAWGQGYNFGPREGVLEQCNEDVRKLFKSHARQVSLVGWSLGGIYARELAKELPDHVRCVITLGTPFSGHPKATNAWRLFEVVSGQTGHMDPEVLAQLRIAPPVPTTSIYSRTDGVVSWKCSLNEPGPELENVEIDASHIGMGTNPLALTVIADRLHQRHGHWKPFTPTGVQRLLFPQHAMAMRQAA